MSQISINPSDTFDSIHNELLSLPPPLLPPGHSKIPELTARIADLMLHPTLEAALHILNHDLPGAHFLVRHMQSAPAFEGMFLHGILHRIEGDYNNARAWYQDVSGGKQDPSEPSDVFSHAWPSQSSSSSSQSGRDEALSFIDAIEKLQKSGEGDPQALEKQSREEIEKVVEWCAQRFGTQRWEEASGAWVKNSEEIKKVSGDMVSGDKGQRKF